MHYEIDYAGFTTVEDKERKACRDVLWYVGPKMYKQVVNFIRREAESFDQVQNAVGLFLGVTGYPVQALWNRYYSEEED